jgi:hypothetical protein
MSAMLDILGQAEGLSRVRIGVSRYGGTVNASVTQKNKSKERIDTLMYVGRKEPIEKSEIRERGKEI